MASPRSRHALFPGGLQVGGLLLGGLVAGQNGLEPASHRFVELRRGKHVDVVAELHALVAGALPGLV